MSRINLQNDNNLDKEKNSEIKKERGGFFVADEDTKEIFEPEETPNETSENVSVQTPELTLEQRQQRNKARLKK